MSFHNAKVYFDGSHYIAIPHTKRKAGKKKVDSIEEIKLKEKFDNAYEKTKGKKKKQKAQEIVKEVENLFEHKEMAETFVNINMERKVRNAIVRKMRFVRKIYNNEWNYFCTFTYDDKKHTEKTFKKALQTCFRNLCYRKGWKYMGVWERAPETNRLHFHGLFNIPAGTLPGEIIEVNDYSTQFHKMQQTFQSSYFNERFGRSDFKEIDGHERRLGNALAYLTKYIEKTGNKIVYSKNLPQYFISDLTDDDVVCTIGQEDKKLLLFDNFICCDEGKVIGEVNPEVIAQMRKSD